MCSPGRGAGELIDGIVGPHLEDVRRWRGSAGWLRHTRLPSARSAGLYACGDVAGHEVLGYVELPDRADEVMRFLARQEIPLPGCSVPRCVPRSAPGPVTCPGTGVMDSRVRPMTDW